MLVFHLKEGGERGRERYIYIYIAEERERGRERERTRITNQQFIVHIYVLDQHFQNYT